MADPAKPANNVSLLTDQELRAELRKFNLPDGPITKTTRRMFEIKLQRALCPAKSRAVCEEKVTETKEENRSPCETPVKVAGVVADVPEQNIFYGVCLPPDDDIEDGNALTPLVFTNKIEALLSAKKNSGARFKAFTSRNEAEAFACGTRATPNKQQSPVVSSTPPLDPIAKFNSLKPGEIVQFRKLIEKGDLQAMLQFMYGNPKYLIASGETPVVLQEGFRYNAMHVAAKSGQKAVCELIMKTLQDDAFWELLHPGCSTAKDSKSQHVFARRKKFVMDLYLNAPDKGFGETPLHFACKYGHADVVEYLLSCTGVDVNFLNKSGETPQTVICTRTSNPSPALRSTIEKMFIKEEVCFVPILRAEDNCSYPLIGSPSEKLENAQDAVDLASPEKPKYKISAYAGPMSPEEAEEFCHALRSPRGTPEEQTKFRNTKRSDSEKGLERVARKMAVSRNVGWCEYWTFLDTFANFSTHEGLVRLEEYLRNKKEEISLALRTEQNYQESKNRHSFDSDDGNCCVFENSPDVPDGNRLESDNGTPRGRNLNGRYIPNRLRLPDTAGEELSNHENCESSLVRNDAQGNSPVDPSEETLSSPTRKLDFDEHNDTLDTSNASEASLSGLPSKFEKLRLSSSSPGLESNSNEEPPRTLPTRICSDTVHVFDNIDAPFFIEGSLPSKVDVDVLRAIKPVNIEPERYPNIYQWRKFVRSFSKSTRVAWPSPGSPRFARTRKEACITWSC